MYVCIYVRMSVCFVETPIGNWLQIFCGGCVFDSPGPMGVAYSLRGSPSCLAFAPLHPAAPQAKLLILLVPPSDLISYIGA